MTTQSHVKRYFPRVREANPVPRVAERCVRSSVTICYATSGCSWYIPQLYVNSGLLQGTGPTAARHLAASRGLETSRAGRSEEHTSELQSRLHLVCRLLLEKKKNKRDNRDHSKLRTS